jgi:NAD(P)-dependent dehydrogenase (short-subunit alcohol dehydrogenase family)
VYGRLGSGTWRVYRLPMHASPAGTRTIVLTGASRGLGAALLRRWLEAGHRVAGCGRRLEPDPDLAAEHGERVRLDAVDVADAAAVERWAAGVLADWGAPDLLVNNAALMNDLAPLWRIPAEEFDRMLAVNVGGTANVVRAFVPAMVERGRGVVVNLSSGWGRSTSPEVGPYCTTKWAIEGFTGSLAQELPAGMAAVAVSPGMVNTDMLRQCWGESAADHETPEAWSLRAADFLLGLGPADSGRSVAVPG